MAAETPLYDLMIVISTTVEDDRRAKILTDVEAQITSSAATIERNDDWRTRALAYEIRHQREGEYHLIQFNGLAEPARLDLAQPPHRRRRAALPDHQGPARHAAAARDGHRRSQSRRPAPRRVLT